MERRLKPLYPRLYSFCYALIPDELQAQQLVVDSISIFLIKEKELIGQWEQSESELGNQELIYAHRLFKLILRFTYELGIKRLSQLQALVNTSKYKFSFYQLSGKERVLIYLKHNLKLSWDDIEFVTKLGRSQLINMLFLAEQKLIELESIPSAYSNTVKEI